MTFSRALRNTDQLIRRWAEEPIGIVVPLAAFLAVWLPPQMPDMFAGMEAPLGQIDASARPFLFAFAAALLGISAWFWTRAALTAQQGQGETDRMRLRRSRLARDVKEPGSPLPAGEEAVAWSHEWAPRLALLAAGGMTLLPILFSIASGRIMPGLMGMELLSFLAVGLPFAFVVHRTRFHWMVAFGAPAWMQRFRFTRILACAPFGWPLAVLSLACSAAALACVIARPDWVGALDAPTTAVAALAFAVGPLVMALAIFRGLTESAIWLLRWLVNRSEPVALQQGELARVQRISNFLGALLMLVWFLLPPLVPTKHQVQLAARPIVEPTQGGDCVADRNLDGLCRPRLEQALQTWVRERRRLSGNGSAPLPLIIVAAEGGASRAALWLLASMRMLDARTDSAFGRHLFAISGVSGGSLGAATYARLLQVRGRADGTIDWNDPAVRIALRTIGTRDLLSAPISTYFLSDMFGSLVGPLWTLSRVPDRNAALEAAFKQLWDGTSALRLPGDMPSGFLDLHRHTAGAMPPGLMPHLLLNGTEVETGKRIITSTIRLAGDPGAFPDSGDFIRLAVRDISLATAVTNSARFPFVSPAGHFSSPTENRDYQVIDGGYFENYGARTAWELARAIEDINRASPSLRVVPVIVVVSNDLAADQPPRRKDGLCRRQLGDRAEDGSQITIRCDEVQADESCVDSGRTVGAGSPEAETASIVPQSIAPFLGLAATRSAHGRDALNIVKRDFCRAQDDSPGQPRVRMIHIALPQPDRDKGEAAPMNWVLNPAACDYMLNTAPWFPFNMQQAQRLKATLDNIRGTETGTRQAAAGQPAAWAALPARPETRRPAPVDCRTAMP